MDHKDPYAAIQVDIDFDWVMSERDHAEAWQ
jgi:hypothetical protein